MASGELNAWFSIAMLATMTGSQWTVLSTRPSLGLWVDLFTVAATRMIVVEQRVPQ